MKTLAFINLKGGTAKTVSAANVAHILAAVHHKKVLLVDADKQGSASRYFGVYGEQDGTAGLLLGPAAGDTEAYIYPTQYKGLDIITSNMDLYSTDRELYEGSADVSGILAAALDRVRNDYDYCIIDNGPAVDMVTLNVLAAADDVLIPIRPDEFSFSGLLDLVEQVRSIQDAVNPGLTMRGAFFTHWQNRPAFVEARDSLAGSGICPVFQTAINAIVPSLVDALEELEKQCVFDAPEVTARKKMRERNRRQTAKQTNAVRFSGYQKNCMRWGVKRRTKPRARAARGPPGWGGP